MWRPVPASRISHCVRKQPKQFRLRSESPEQAIAQLSVSFFHSHFFYRANGCNKIDLKNKQRKRTDLENELKRLLVVEWRDGETIALPPNAVLMVTAALDQKLRAKSPSPRYQ